MPPSPYANILVLALTYFHIIYLQLMENVLLHSRCPVQDSTPCRVEAASIFELLGVGGGEGAAQTENC